MLEVKDEARCSNCSAPSIYARTLCKLCYGYQHRFGRPRPVPCGPRRKRIEPCINCGHTRPISAKGLCRTCYAYQYRTGRPRPYPRVPAPRRSKATGWREAQRRNMRERAADLLADPNAHRLTERQRAVLQRRASGHTLEEIGRDWGITRERVRQIEHKAMRCLRPYMRAMHHDQEEHRGYASA